MFICGCQPSVVGGQRPAVSFSALWLLPAISVAGCACVPLSLKLSKEAFDEFVQRV
jgi:hypothetical protein